MLLRVGTGPWGLLLPSGTPPKCGDYLGAVLLMTKQIGTCDFFFNDFPATEMWCRLESCGDGEDAWPKDTRHFFSRDAVTSASL